MPDLRELGRAVKQAYPGQFDNEDDAELGFAVRESNPEEFKDFVNPADLTPGAGQSALRGAAQWGSLGFSDEAAGLVGAAAAKTKAGEQFIDPRMITDPNDPRAPTPEHLAQQYPGVEAGGLDTHKLWEKDYLRSKGVNSWQELADRQAAEADKVPWLGEAYEKTRDKQRLMDDLAWDAHPKAYATGAVATLLPSLLGGAGRKGAARALEGAGVRQIPRISRAALEAVKVGVPVGAAAGLGGSRGENAEQILNDVGVGAATGGVLHLGGQGVGKLLKSVGGKLKYAAKRAFVRALDPTEAEVEVIKKQFSPKGTPGYERDPAAAADRLRAMTTPEGETLLPATASHQTRLKNVGSTIANAKGAKTALIDQAHKAGAAISPDAVVAEAGDLLGGTVGGDVNMTIAGGASAEEANKLLQRFLGKFKRPASVRTDAAGNPLIARSVRQAPEVPSSSVLGPDGRLEGSGAVFKGVNVSPGKRAALRIEDQPGIDAFGPTHDSTLTPKPYSGWHPIIDPEKPFTLAEADHLATALQDDVLRTASGYPDPKAQAAFKQSPEAAFKLGLARILRQQIAQQTGEKLGGRAQLQLEKLNSQMSDLATVSPMLTRKFNRGFTGTELPSTSVGLKHRVLPRTAASYVDQLMDPFYRATGAAADKLSQVPGAELFTKMKTIKRQNPDEEEVP